MEIAAEAYSDFKQAVESEPLIKDVAVGETSDSVIVSLLTHPIFLRSEGEALVRRIRLFATAHFKDKTIYITRDADVFYKLRGIGGEKSAAELIEIVKYRQKT